MLKIYQKSTYGHSLQNLTLSKKWLSILLMLLIASTALSEPAFAQSFGKVEGALQKLITALTGPIAKAIAAIVVVGVGIARIAGRYFYFKRK